VCGRRESHDTARRLVQNGEETSESRRLDPEWRHPKLVPNADPPKDGWLTRNPHPELAWRLRPE
jgi:hypothetical protein